MEDYNNLHMLVTFGDLTAYQKTLAQIEYNKLMNEFQELKEWKAEAEKTLDPIDVDNIDISLKGGIKKPEPKPQCPECLAKVDQEELDMFDGWCETCYENKPVKSKP